MLRLGCRGPASHPVELPSGRVRLGEKHTFVTGLSTILTDAVRKPVSDALNDASRVCGTILHAASRLLLLYATEVLAEGIAFSHTGLTSGQSFGHKDNIAWHGTAPPAGDAPYIFTQELCGWAMSVFCAKRSTHTTTKVNPAFQRLERLAAEHKLVEALGGTLDNSHLGSLLQSLQKSLAVVLSNHLTVATKAHTKLYLKAKYAHLYLTNKEAEQLATTVGRSVQWNAFRTQKRKGVPYDKLPPHREAKEITRYGEAVLSPEVDAMEWRAVVDAEWELLPATWAQSDMLRRRFAMLVDIQSRSTAAKTLTAFNLLPLCRSGRVFLKLNTPSLVDICKRAKVNGITDKTVLSLFHPVKLCRLLRHPTVLSENTRELLLGGEFFRSDGVQAQFYCGTKYVPKGKKRARLAYEGEVEEEEEENAVSPQAGVEVSDGEEEDVVSPCPPVPESFENLYACDPGRTNLYTVVKARLVGEEERLAKFPDLKPTGDGRHVVWEKVPLPPEREGKFTARYLSMSKAAFDEMRGGRARRQERKEWVAGCAGYKAALSAISAASLSCVDAKELGRRVAIHAQSHAALHAVEGSRTLAHARFDAFRGKQKTLAKISRDFESVLGDKGVLAWGGARWAVCAKGSAPCAANMIFRHLQKARWAKLPDGRSRIPTEAETNTSCKNAIGLFEAKMVHPLHKRFCAVRNTFNTVFAADGSVVSRTRLGRSRLGVLRGGRPHGLYLCNEGEKRTCGRDTNGASNIWRAYWERCHGRERPEALRSRREKQQGDAPARPGRSA